MVTDAITPTTATVSGASTFAADPNVISRRRGRVGRLRRSPLDEWPRNRRNGSAGKVKVVGRALRLGVHHPRVPEDICSSTIVT